MKRRFLLSALTGLMLVTLPSAAMAQDGSSAEATALGLEGILVISHSEAQDGSASSTGIEVLGSQVVGSSQEGEGTSQTALIDTADLGVPADAIRVAVAPSSSTVNGDGSSESHSDLVVVDLGDGMFRLEVLSADAASDGSAESDGVVLSSTQDPTGEGIHVLHAEVAGGEGNTAVAVLGGTGVITDEQTGNAFCALDAVVVAADVVCVAATEGGGIGAGVADDVTLAGTPVGDVVTAGSNPSGAGAPPEVLPESFDNEPNMPPSLPRTGIDALALLIMAAGAVTGGDQLRRRGITVA